MDMYRFRRNLLGAAFLSAFSIPCAFAFTPTVEITEPSGIHYVAGFPANVNVTLSLSVFNTSNNNCITNGIKSITVNAQRGDDPATTIHTSSSDPINNSTQLCPAPYGFNWSVAAPGSYTLLVTVKHGNDTGVDTETVEFLMLTVEYPAPPAVANAYINSVPLYKSASGKKRGCIISKIAEKHAKLAGEQGGYGAKGGPYDEPAIRQDVDLYYAGAGC